MVTVLHYCNIETKLVKRTKTVQLLYVQSLVSITPQIYHTRRRNDCWLDSSNTSLAVSRACAACEGGVRSDGTADSVAWASPTRPAGTAGPPPAPGLHRVAGGTQPRPAAVHDTTQPRNQEQSPGRGAGGVVGLLGWNTHTHLAPVEQEQVGATPVLWRVGVVEWPGYRSSRALCRTVANVTTAVIYVQQKWVKTSRRPPVPAAWCCHSALPASAPGRRPP